MKKRRRFKEIKIFPNVFEYDYHDFINNASYEQIPDWDNVIVEIACGKAEHSLYLAKKYPNKRYYAVDMKGNRLWKPAKECLENNIQNLFFLRTDVNFISKMLKPHSVQEIWITFPDPYVRMSKAKKRLTSQRFLAMYKEILKKNGMVHLKTDSKLLVKFSLETIKNSNGQVVIQKEKNISQNEQQHLDFPFNIISYYEKLNISCSKKVYYLAFKL